MSASCCRYTSCHGGSFCCSGAFARFHNRYYLESERNGVKDFLRCRTVGLCMTHNRATLSLESAAPMRPVCVCFFGVAEAPGLLSSPRPPEIPRRQSDAPCAIRVQPILVGRGTSFAARARPRRQVSRLSVSGVLPQLVPEVPLSGRCVAALGSCKRRVRVFMFACSVFTHLRLLGFTV